jgi:hypothetical protein
MNRIMVGKKRGLGVGLVLLLLLGAAPAVEAQAIGGDRYSRPQQPQPRDEPQPPPIPNPKEHEAVPEPWPRLEVGALLCKSRDDLVKYQTKIADGANAATAEQSLDCHKLRKQTGIQILDHDGPSRTQVVTTDKAKETGWTNTYLPATPPQSAKSTDAEK